MTNYTKSKKEPLKECKNEDQQFKKRNSSVIEDDFDLIDFNEEVKKANKQVYHGQSNLAKTAISDLQEGTFAIAQREYSIIDIDKKTVS